MSSILASLRSRLPDEELRAHMAARTAHHVPATGAMDPASILTLDTIEQALAAGVVPPRDVRVFGGYHRLDLRYLGLVKDGAVRARELLALARQGTLVITNAQRLSAELSDLACATERWLGGSVSLTAVASFRKSGIALHYDQQEVIVAHLAGSKTWSFYGPPVADSAVPLASHYEGVPTEITEEVVLRPGDLLYVPSGLFHRCTPGDWSLHLSVVVSQPVAGMH